MSPRTGRPPSENPKFGRITIRLTDYEQKVLLECAKQFGTSNADIFRRGLELMNVEKENGQARQLFDAIVLLQDLIEKENFRLVQGQIEQVKYNFQRFLDSVKQ